MAELKTLNGYEIVDQTARDNIDHRNLLLRSGTFTGNWYNANYWTYDSSLDGLVVLKRSDKYYGITQEIYVAAGETYTYSVYLKTDASVFYLWPFCGIDNEDLKADTVHEMYHGNTQNNGYTRYYLVISVIKPGIIRPGVEMDSSGTMYITAPKLERGSIPTLWSPAPEDAVGGQIIGGSIAPNNDFGINGDFYVMY